MIILIERFKRTLDSRKYQLQKQIIEAFKANDNDLYSLLKSQWAHRFGVESLDELKNLDLNQFNQKPIIVNNQKVDQLQEKSFEDDKEIAKKDHDNQVKEIKTSVIESTKDDNYELLKSKSYEIMGKENDENKFIDQMKGIQSQQKVEALIPLPPKPKYGYFKKWLLSN